MRTFLALAVACAVTLSFGSPRPKAQDQKTDSEAPAPAKIVESLDWLAGHWIGTSGKNRYESVYTSPARGQIFGASKEFNAHRMVMFDFERIYPRGEDVFMTPWPNGHKSVSFKLTDYDPGKKRLRFENPEHDFPQSFTYSLEKTGRLVITLEGTMAKKNVSYDIVLARLEQ